MELKLTRDKASQEILGGVFADRTIPPPFPTPYSPQAPKALGPSPVVAEAPSSPPSMAHQPLPSSPYCQTHFLSSRHYA